MIMTWLLDMVDISFPKPTWVNFFIFFSPAAYKGHSITKSDLEKDFANSLLRDKTLENR